MGANMKMWMIEKNINGTAHWWMRMDHTKQII